MGFREFANQGAAASRPAFTRDEIVPFLRRAGTRAAERAEKDTEQDEADFHRGEAWGFEKAARFVQSFLDSLP